MFNKQRSLLDPQNDVQSSFELFVSRVVINLADQTDQLGHDGFVAVRERGKARAQSVLRPDTDMAVVRCGLEFDKKKQFYIIVIQLMNFLSSAKP